MASGCRCASGALTTAAATTPFSGRVGHGSPMHGSYSGGRYQSGGNGHFRRVVSADEMVALDRFTIDDLDWRRRIDGKCRSMPGIEQVSPFPFRL